MTIDRIAPLSFRPTTDQVDTSHDDQLFHRAVAEAYCDSLQRAPSVPDLSKSASSGAPLASAAPKPGVVQYDHVTDVLPFDHTFSETGWDCETAMFAGSVFASAPGVSSAGFPPLWSSARSIARAVDFLIPAALLRAQDDVENLVASLNDRAIVSVSRKGDTLIVRALNKAASNTLRAFAGLIRSRAFAFSDVHYVGYSFNSRSEI